jgi:uncharacterized repeat protein (TIGR03943 family)
MRLGAPLVAAGYGAYLFHAYWSGALYFYIHPAYIAPTVVAGVILLALAAAAGWREGSDAHRHGPWSALAVSIVMLPLALGVLLPPQPLSSAVAGQRGVELTSLGGLEAGTGFSLGARPEAYTIKDWVKAFQVDPEPSRHAGKPVRVTGFVYRDDRLPAGWFLVARFVLKCCAVDAQPVGLPVRADGAVPEPGRWVTVEGAWEVAEVDGVRRAVIKPEAVTATARPDQPYLY